MTTTRDTDDELEIARARIANLETALQTSRTIGMAVGIVVERQKISAEEAFELLTNLSRQSQRKLREIASDIVYTGVIPPLT